MLLEMSVLFYFTTIVNSINTPRGVVFSCFFKIHRFIYHFLISLLTNGLFILYIYI